MNPAVWQPPPPPPYRSEFARPSQALALASMITAIAGFVFGLFCLGPLPGIAALIMGVIALSQIKKTPDKVTGKPFAVAGIIIGSINILIFLGWILWLIFAVSFG